MGSVHRAQVEGSKNKPAKPCGTARTVGTTRTVLGVFDVLAVPLVPGVPVLGFCPGLESLCLNELPHLQEILMCRPIFILALLALAVPTAAAEPHPFTVHDLLAMERISDPEPSPQGDKVAFELRTTDLEANKGRFDLWLVNMDGIR